MTLLGVSVAPGVPPAMEDGGDGVRACRRPRFTVTPRDRATTTSSTRNAVICSGDERDDTVGEALVTGVDEEETDDEEGKDGDEKEKLGADCGE